MAEHLAVKADPKRPYKAIAAGVLAFLGLLWANLQGVDNWSTLGFQDWVTIIVPTILTFGGTYFVSNPTVAVHRLEHGYAILGALGLGLIVLTVLLLVATLLKVVVVSWVVLIVLFVIGLVLLWLDGRGPHGRGVV